MKEFLQAKKTLIAVAAIIIIILFMLFYLLGEFGCFGCNVFGDSCGFWGCFETCTDCIGCAFGCD